MSKQVQMLTIFDCDGVLVESEAVALETLSHLMAAWGRPMSVGECRDAFMGRHNRDIVAEIELRLGRPLPLTGGGGELRARILENVVRDLQPVAGAAEMLTRLVGPRCVASSSDAPRVRQLLEHAGLHRFFGDAIFSGADVPRGKPAPDIFLHAADVMGFAPRDCLVIEDSVQGVMAGVAAGMHVIGFIGGQHADASHADRLRAVGASVIATSMTELSTFLVRKPARLATDQSLLSKDRAAVADR